MINPAYLVDSSVLITAANTWYAFDIVPSFWNRIHRHLEDGSLGILDVVHDEVMRGHDDLMSWLKAEDFPKISTNDADILNRYSDVVEYILQSRHYTDQAKLGWITNREMADPWLIASAAVLKIPIITLEKAEPNRRSSVKIPDVADHFHVPILHLFQMMRELRLAI